MIVHDGRCTHPRQEAVVNYGNEVIAWRCSVCTDILSHVGTCGHCGQYTRLYVFSGRGRYCSDDCLSRRRAARAKLNEERRRRAVR